MSGKGSGPRKDPKGDQGKKYRENWDNIFKNAPKKKPTGGWPEKKNG